MISAQGVSKAFGNTTVIDDLTLEIPAGQIYGLIGPSGCGKTTVVKMLMGVYAPSSGAVRVLGVPPVEFTTAHREQIGYTPQGFPLYPTLTVAENARFIAGLYGLGFMARRRRVRSVLEFLELWEARKRMARDISGGMQRRLTLACALIHEPMLLLVDEPTAGLDPVLREKIWGLLRTLRDQGVTIFVTTQYIDEASYCDTVAILNKGKLAAEGTPDELRRQALGGEIVTVDASGLDKDDVVALLRLKPVHMVEWVAPERLRLTVEEVATAIPEITDALRERGREIHAVRPEDTGFQEVFMKIVGAA